MDMHLNYVEKLQVLPLSALPPILVFQYARTEVDSKHFPMTWVAAYADVWQAIVDPGTHKANNDFLKYIF